MVFIAHFADMHRHMHHSAFEGSNLGINFQTGESSEINDIRNCWLSINNKNGYNESKQESAVHARVIKRAMPLLLYI